jgi:truncated hemoglobin YjbI
MNYQELKPLIQYGDCKEVAEICNVSVTFVQNVWKGVTRGTANADAVMTATLMKIAERQAYQEKIKQAIIMQKAERKAKQMQNQSNED